MLLQEVAGVEEGASHEPRDPEDGLAAQLEALADEAWPYYAYGKNSIFAGGFHGNAILSKYPIQNWGNIDITIPPLHTRGCLHAEVVAPDHGVAFHLLSVHLGLWQTERRLQLSKLADYLSSHLAEQSSVLLAGDFNDWRENASKKLGARLGLDEAFLESNGKYARTFPSRWPMLALDRMYFRGMHVKRAIRITGAPWNQLSDHLPLLAEFQID